MRHRRPVALWTCCLLWFLGASVAVARGDDLASGIVGLIEEPRFRHAHWGILVADLESGEVLYETNADKLFVPASTTKLFSVAAALEALGADHRFETRLLRRGEVDVDGTLEGDLILLASGDFTLGGRTLDGDQIAYTNSDHIYANGSAKGELTEPDPLAGLDALARQVLKGGIRQVTGDVIVDDRLFDHDTGSGSGPSTLTPIMVNDNLIDVVVKPTAVGEAAEIEWRPRTAAAAVEGAIKTVAPGDSPRVTIISSPGNRLQVIGQIPSDHAPILRVHEVDHPASFARSLLIEALHRVGVAVSADVAAENRAAQLPPRETVAELPTVASLTSPPFSEAARLILKVSHNLHASTLPLLLAAEQGERSLGAGLRRQRELLFELGVEVDTISFGGGAGGSRADYVTPRATVALLRTMATRDDFDVYHRALPILGVDGTLADVVDDDSPARRRVHAKTGTLYWRNVMNERYLLTSKALAGYMTTASERRLAFSLVVNNVHLESGSQTADIGRALGRLCEIIHDAL